ncbi:MAG: hypothetical protein K9I95_03980 [Flavobacteriaceae bacterium]|nr:hypothetical protein [Flavobacteriaceae bacterium]
MKLYIKNLVNRLSRFSEKLDNIEMFVEKKWVLIDEEGNQQTFIFERDGDLVMSLNGQVKMGKWKYYPAARSIKIDRITDQILLNQAFFDKAVMILKYDGLPDRDLFTLADANVIPDLDVKKYLLSVINTKLNVTTDKLLGGNSLEVYRGASMMTKEGMEVTINGSIPEDGQYYSKLRNFKYVISDSKIKKIFYLYGYKISRGVSIVIEQQSNVDYCEGDQVLIDGQPAPSGKYKLDFLDYIIVKDGVIVESRSW